MSKALELEEKEMTATENETVKRVKRAEILDYLSVCTFRVICNISSL